MGTLAQLPKIAGNQSLVRELAFSARDFSAEDALRVGLVSRVVKGGRAEVVQAALGLAGEIARKSPIAVLGTKRVLLHARDHSCVLVQVIVRSGKLTWSQIGWKTTSSMSRPGMARCCRARCARCPCQFLLCALTHLWSRISPWLWRHNGRDKLPCLSRSGGLPQSCSFYFSGALVVGREFDIRWQHTRALED